MPQANIKNTSQIPGGKTFNYVRMNWNDLDKIERLGISAMIVILAKKKRIERSVKKQILLILQGH
jgi:hypothetical protein